MLKTVTETSKFLLRPFSSNTCSHSCILRTVMTQDVDVLEQRAHQADLIIAELQKKISAIKEKYVDSVRGGLEERLTRENAQLRAEISALKQQLVFVEVRNGVKQVPLPSLSASDTVSTTVSACTVPDQSASAASTSTSAAENKSAAGEQKKEKPKKKGGEGKVAPSGGGDDKPIDVSRLDMRVGVIESVEKHPDADSLYVETVNVGEDKPRTIVSGLVKHVPLEKMQNLRAIFLCNLKPAKMRGVQSEGMIMCASCPDKVEIIEIPQDAEPGTRITFSEYPGTPDALLPPKKKIWESVAPDLKIDGDGMATYKGAPFRLYGETVCKAPSLTNVQIK